MTNREFYILTSEFTSNPSETLEDVGRVLKRRLIDFTAATKLRDLVRAGRVNEVRAKLDTIIRTNARSAQDIKPDPLDN